MSKITKLAEFIAGREWSLAAKEEFDCSRNAAREILAAVGWDDETDCLRSFWSCMTMVKMMKKDDYLLGSEHLDYGPVPNPPLGLDKLADINAYQKKCLQDDLPIFKKAVETLIAHVDALCLSDWSEAFIFFLAELHTTLDNVSEILDLGPREMI